MNRSHLFAFALLIISGCRDSSTPPRLVNAQMKSINLAYHMHCIVADRAPANLEELLTGFGESWPESHNRADNETKRLLKEGEYLVIWNEQRAVKADSNNDCVIAYQKQVPERGGFVVRANGVVVHMTPEEFRQATSKAP